MKFGFSTLSCPGWLWNEILATASDLGYDGIELRGIAKEMYLPNVKEFSLEEIPTLRDKLKKMNLEIPCLTTGAFLFDPKVIDKARREVVDYLLLAAVLGVPYIRVLADANPEPGIVDENLVVENLNSLLPIAKENNVTLLVETNGIYASSLKLKELIEKVNHPNLSVLWDVHHPYRYYNEAPDETYQNLKPWIKHIHIKDSEIIAGKVKYRMLGCGDIPVAEVVSLLHQDGFSGYLVLEWVKRWNMDLEEAGIVLPHYLNTIKNMVPKK